MLDPNSVTITKELNKVVRKYIINCINWTEYDYPECRKIDDLLIITTEGKLNFLYDTFRAEYGWHIEQVGEYKAFEEWIKGLPSVFNIAFSNYDILQLAKEWGSIPEDATEKQEDKILNNYWNFITVKTFQLFRKFKIGITFIR